MAEELNTFEWFLVGFKWFLVGAALYGAVTFWANTCALLIDCAIRRFQQRR